MKATIFNLSNKIILLVSIIGLITISCKEEKIKETQKQPVKEIAKVMHKDVVTWKGYKPTGSHNGTISVKSNDLKITKENTITGSINMDMSSITCTDIKAEQDNKDLVGHLSNADFFDVAKYPTAKFEFTNVSVVQ